MCAWVVALGGDRGLKALFSRLVSLTQRTLDKEVDAWQAAKAKDKKAPVVKGGNSWGGAGSGSGSGKNRQKKLIDLSNLEKVQDEDIFDKVKINFDVLRHKYI